MARLIFEDLSIEQAKELASWYCEHGEQDSCDWLDEADLPNVNVDVAKMRGDCIVEGEDVIVRTKA